MSSERDRILAWAEQGRIAPDNVQPALRVAAALPTHAQWCRFIDRLLLWIGAVMLAAAVVFFFAYNWSELGRYARFALAEGALIVAVLAAWKLGLDRMSGQAALVAAALLVGALLALVGQTYQTGADPWELFATWAVAILPWVLIAALPALWLIELALVNVAAWQYYSVFGGWLGLAFDAADLLWWLFGLNTIALVAWELVAPQRRWAPRIVATASGVMATMVALWAIFDSRFSSAGLIAWALWMAAAYVVYRHRTRDLYVLAGGVLSAVVVVASLLARGLLDTRHDDAAALLLIGLAVIGLSAAGGWWLKQVAREGA